MTQPYQDSVPQDPLDPSFTDDLLHALAAALPSPEQETDVHKRRRQAAAMAVLRSFDAQEPAEAMLASHVVLAHQFTLECYRRAAHATTASGLDTNLLVTAAMQSRAMRRALDALERWQDEPVWMSRSDDVSPQR